MPVIIFEGPELNQKQREAMIRGFTEVASQAMPEIPKEAFYVYLREYPGEKLGVGGLTLPEYLKKIGVDMGNE